MVLPSRWKDTELITYEPRSESGWGVALILVLSLGLIGIGISFAAGILGFMALPPVSLAALMGLGFIDIGLITIVYFKMFLPYMVIARDEHPEDILW